MKNSSAEADGHWGRLDSYDQVGSGGGSGGSIQIITQNLMGDGHVSVKGGYGSANGGGGGSGGRFVMKYTRSYLSSSYPNQSYYWYGTYDINGGI